MQNAGRIASMIFALTLPVAGCGSSVGKMTDPPPMPMTRGAIATESWSYDRAGKTVTMPGEWLHLPAEEAGELLLWMEQAGGNL